MNLNTILKKAWQILWNYRALWLFGAVLGLVGPKVFYPGPWSSWENNDQWTKIVLNSTTTIQVPGIDMTIDLTAPGGFRIITPDVTSWHEFDDLIDQLDREASINLRPILIEIGLIFGILLILGVLARYITETAVIRMVDETEQTGRRLSVWRGLRRGFSFRAGRLFLLDLVIGALVAVALILVFGLVNVPILLAIGSSEVILITAGLVTFGLLLLAFFVFLIVSVLLSLVMQPIRRSCILEQQSLWASIRQGIMLTRHHLKEVSTLWLLWIGIRLVWVPLSVMVLILLLPFLLLTIPLGIPLSGLPAALVAAVAALFWGGATPWIMGGLAGLPIFLVVIVSPLLFVSGLVQIYMSTIWTLTYRDLRAVELPA
jgi:hypothetical protein